MNITSKGPQIQDIGLKILTGLVQDFYSKILTENNYREERFHELGRKKGLTAHLVSQVLDKKKARIHACFKYTYFLRILWPYLRTFQTTLLPTSPHPILSCRFQRSSASSTSHPPTTPSKLLTFGGPMSMRFGADWVDRGMHANLSPFISRF